MYHRQNERLLMALTPDTVGSKLFDVWSVKSETRWFSVTVNNACIIDWCKFIVHTYVIQNLSTCTV